MEPEGPTSEEILSLESLKRSLDRGISESWRDGLGLSLLHLLALSPNAAGLRHLLSLGWDPTIQVAKSEVGSFNGMSPIHLAAYCGRTECVTALAQTQGVANSVTPLGLTPLHFAAMGNPQAAEIFLVMGADPNALDIDGETPFIHACGAANIGSLATDKILNLFIEKGANLFSLNKNKLSALHLAADAGSDDWVEHFLDAGIDVNSVTAAGEAPLHRSARFDHATTCRLLIEHGAEINKVSVSGKTPLSLALERKACEAIKVLLEFGAIGGITTAKPTSKGRLSISLDHDYLALENHRDEQACNIVRALILAGGNFQASDHQGITPLHICFLPEYLGRLSKDLSGCYSNLL